MLSGLKDQVVPPKHMLDLWNIATQRGKSEGDPPENASKGNDKFVTFDYGGHGMLFKACSNEFNLKAS